MKEKLLQKMADLIIRKLSEAKSEDAIHFYNDMGLWLDRMAINTFGIYLN